MKSARYLLLAAMAMPAAQALSTGDLAFTAFNTDGDDDFAVVALTDIPANTTIYFTDSESNGAGNFESGEGKIEWQTGASVIAAGSVVLFSDAGSSSGLAASVGNLINVSGDLNLASGGDAIIAYEGTDASTPTTFIAAVANSSGEFGDLTGTGLSEGSTAFVFTASGDPDGGVYNGARSGEATIADYASLISNLANWSTTNDGESLLPFNSTAFITGVLPTSGPASSLYQAVLTGEGSGEVVSHAKIGSDFVLAVTDNPNGGVTILKWVDGNQKYQTQFSIDVSSVVSNFNGVSSVALDPRGTGLGAVTVQVDDPSINTTGDLSIPQIGAVVFFDATTGSIIGQATTGYHPDMVVFGPTGYCAVANEAEYAWDEDSETALPGSNQNGSVSLYDLSSVTAGNLTPAASVSEINVDFTAATLTGVRYGTAEEMEPEYVAFDATGDTIFVGCQENNAVVVLNDLAGIFASTTTPAWEVYDLGQVTYITDASDKDGVDISDRITGLHMPDAIAVYEDGGKTYVVTADEGDARPDDSDITRAGDFASDEDDKVAATPLYDAGSGALSQSAFDALLQDNDELGRIDVLIDQATDINGDLTDMICLGSRGVSVFEYDSSMGTLTRVSHLPLESYLAQQDPTIHNANDGGDPGEADKRSDNKGPEPEAVSVIQLGSKIVAMVGNERQNSVVMVDITDPANPAPISYINNRGNGLNSPETVQTVAAADSPTGEELAIFGYEGDSGISGGIGIYSLEAADEFKLTILHNNDGESDLIEYNSSSTEYGNVARFKTAMDAHGSFFENTGHGVLKVFAGDSFLPGAAFQASVDAGTYYGALAISRIGYDAVTIGNHEFDFGPNTLASFITDAQTTNATTCLSANLDLSAEANLDALVTSGEIASSKVVEVATESGVKKVGVIGATTENLPFISSPGAVVVNAVAASVNAEIASFNAMGDIDSIVLVSHLQGISEDEDLIPALSAGVDIIVAGGGDELLGDVTKAAPSSVYGAGAPASVVDTGIIPGDSFFDTDENVVDTQSPYPFVSTNTDLGGNTVPIVTSAGSYGYLGRVTLCFDGLGGVTVEATSNPAVVGSTTALGADGYDADADVVAESVTPVETFIGNLASVVIGNANALMVGGASSDNIRSAERAVGNLVADAYLAKAQQLAASFGVDSPQIAMSNGGGIRGDVAAGDITLATTFDIARFSNFVAVVEDVTTADLKLLLENSYSKTIDADPTNGVNPQRQGDGTGRFAQIAGMSVVYDISKDAMVLDGGTESITTPGVRIVSASLDDNTVLIQNGNPVPGLTVDIAMPAFVANGGDQWFRYAGGGSVYYTSVQYPFTALGATDQQALADYIISLDGTVDGTGPAIDSDTRYDSTADGRIVAISDRDSDGIQDIVEPSLGTDPDVADIDATTILAAIAAQNAANLAAAETQGEQNVVNDPASFNLFTETSILDLRMNGVMGPVNTGAGTATLDIDVYSTTDLGAGFPAGWTLESTEAVTVPAPAGKAFYRLNADQP